MKKYILFSLLFCMAAVIAKSQGGQPSGFPITNSTGYIKYGYIQQDSGRIDAKRDTNWLPSKVPTTVYWQHAGVDTAFWTFNGKAVGNQRWDKTSGSGGSTVVPTLQQIFDVESGNAQLNKNNFINANGHDFTIFSSSAPTAAGLIITPTYASLDGYVTGGTNYVRVFYDSIQLSANNGKYNIDMSVFHGMRTATDTGVYKPMVLDPSTGMWKRLTYWPGSPPLRFGVSGEDDIATADRLFNLNDNTLTLEDDDLKDSANAGLILTNEQLADGANTVQNSPALLFRSNARKTGIPQNTKISEWKIWSAPQSGSGSIAGRLYISNGLNGTFDDAAYFEDLGILNLKNAVKFFGGSQGEVISEAGISYTAGNGGHLFSTALSGGIEGTNLFIQDSFHVQPYLGQVNIDSLREASSLSGYDVMLWGDGGQVKHISSSYFFQNLQSVTDIGYVTTNPMEADYFKAVNLSNPLIFTANGGSDYIQIVASAAASGNWIQTLPAKTGTFAMTSDIVNVYNSNGTLSGNRTLTGAGNTFTFGNMGTFTIQNGATNTITAVATEVAIGAALRMFSSSSDPSTSNAGDVYYNTTSGRFFGRLAGIYTQFLMTGDGGTGTVNNGNQYRIAYYATTGTSVSEAAAITGNRALISDANGVPTHATTTATEIGYVNGVTSSIQTQLNARQTTTLTNGNFLVGNISNVATSVTPTGDVTFDNAGVFTIGTNKVLTANILNSNVTLDKIANIADQTILGNNTGGSAAPLALTATQVKTILGVTTVGNNFFTLSNPSAITFPRINADNTVSALDAATFRTAIGAGTGDGTVTSVTGTTNRITSTGGTTPQIDISASYVGQTSITTLGTISTGVWNGTAIANANLANSTITIGTTSIALGATSTSLAGMSGITMADAGNIVVNTATGTKIGTATSQKLGFFNSTPVIQQTGNLISGLSNLGLIVSGSLASGDIPNNAANTSGSAGSVLNSLSIAAELISGGATTYNGSAAKSIAIQTNAVTNTMLAQVATATFKGRTTAGTGNVEDLTATQATALLNVFGASLKGLVPAASASPSSTKYLSEDGTFTTPAGGTGMTFAQTSALMIIRY